MERLYSDTKDYLHVRNPSNVFEDDVLAPGFTWMSRCYHNFYQSYHKEWDNSTAVLLELGGGPCIYPLISAVPYVAEIYHSDYTKACRDEVLMWKSKDPNAHDWSPYFKLAVQTFEGQAGPNAFVKLKEKLRKIFNVVQSDVKADVMVPDVEGPINIISSNYCLECSLNLSEYSVALKKIYDLLVPKGFFVSQSLLGNTWFNIAGVKCYSSFSLSLQEAKTHYEQAGFDVVHAEVYDVPLAARIHDDATGQGFFIARKR